MPKRTAISTAGNNFNLYCETADDNLLPPVLRLLLKDKNPKSIKKITHDYDLLSCERQALKMIQGNGSAIHKNQESPLIAPRMSKKILDTATAGGLLNEVTLYGKISAIPGPNVDIRGREKPAEAHSGVHTVHRLYMAAAFKLLGGADNTGVGALIVDPNGQILAFGKKNPLHPILHAETSALLAYGSKLPKGSRIYSTLKPCQMCRSFIQHFATDGDFLVYYTQDDPTAAAIGGGGEFVQLKGGNGKESPMWVDKNARLQTTVASELSNKYAKAHEKDKDLGIIDFIKNDDSVSKLIKKAGEYLSVKKKKYDNTKLTSIHNANTDKCLQHIIDALSKTLNIQI